MERIVSNGYRDCTALLDGTECKVVFDHCYRAFAVINDSTEDVFVSIEQGKSSGEDGVRRIAPGCSSVLAHMRTDIDTVYVTGSGSVQIAAQNGTENPFKPQSGGGDLTINGNVVTPSATNGNIRVDGVEVEVYDDTEVLNSAKKYADSVANNPNLLINPDFRVNQRGQTEYTGDWIYSVDRWQSFSCKVIPVSDGINLSLTGTEYFSVIQKFENTLPFGQYTISWSIDNHIYTGTGLLDENGFAISFNQSRVELHSNWLQFYMISVTDITINWVKLELGSIATPFVPPDPATELVKCQRFYRSVSRGIYVEVCDASSTHSDIILRLPFESPMRTPPTANILNHNAIFTYCNGWIDEPTELTIIGSNITQYGICYLHIDGLNLTVNGQPLPTRTPITLATDNVIGLDAEIY